MPRRPVIVQIRSSSRRHSPPAAMAQEEPPPGDPFVTGDEIGEQIDGSDWTPCTEALSGRVYYYNFGSVESVWELPDDGPAARGKCGRPDVD